MSNEKENPLKVMTPKFRLSFPQLFEPKGFQNQAPKYSIQMLFDKSTDLAHLKASVKLAIKEKWGDIVPKNLTLPFKDGNDKDLDGYEDKIVVSTSTKFLPIVVDQKREAILDEKEIYAGCYCRAQISAYPWEQKDPSGKTVLKRGVSFNLIAVQKLSDGESFVKRANAEDIFDEVSDSSKNSENYENDDWLN